MSLKESTTADTETWPLARLSRGQVSVCPEESTTAGTEPWPLTHLSLCPKESTTASANIPTGPRKLHRVIKGSTKALFSPMHMRPQSAQVTGDCLAHVLVTNERHQYAPHECSKGPGNR